MSEQHSPQTWEQMGKAGKAVSLRLADDFHLELHPSGPRVGLSVGGGGHNAYRVYLHYVDAVNIANWLLGWLDSREGSHQGFTENDIRRIVRDEMAGERP